MRSKLLLLFTTILLVNGSKLYCQVISTVAGNGSYGYSGNGGPATAAQLAWPSSIAFDNAGNLYIADHDNDVIRVVNSAGIISNFAGTGVLGYTGDGGLATVAELYHPASLAFDGAGNLYFTDQNADVIRRITTSGIITTIAGKLPSGYSGDGGPLAAAQFNSISGLTFDKAGNLYISDFGNNVIRKVNTSGMITTIAGNGTNGFSGDGGPATKAQLNSPYDVVIDNGGNIYIPDNGNQRIRKIDPSGVITTVAGNGNKGYSGDGGPATQAAFFFPWTICLDAQGNIYVGDIGNFVVRKIGTDGIITTFAGTGVSGNSGDGGPATAATFNEIRWVAVDNAGNVYVLDRGNVGVVRKISMCLLATVQQHPLDQQVCETGNVKFQVKADNVLAYQWEINTGSGWNKIVEGGLYSGSLTGNLSVHNATSSQNNFQYRCLLSNGCGANATMPAKLVVLASSTSVQIEASALSICEHTSVTFKATPENGGSKPSYQWKKNNSNVGQDTPEYTDATLKNGDRVSCILTSNSTCLNTPSATSNIIAVSVTPSLMPSVAITASANNVCEKKTVAFTAFAVNGGTAPAYTWTKNGIKQQEDQSTYTDVALKNGDVIQCALASSLSCIASQSVNSNSIVMKINALQSPSIAIVGSTTKVCNGDAATFTATVSNAGLSTLYQWKVNDQNVGTNAATLTDVLKKNDQVRCELKTSGVCLVTDKAVSNTIAPNVVDNPKVTLDKGSTICSGSYKSLDAGKFSTYLWSTGSTNRSIQVNHTGRYWVQVVDNNGCKGSDTTQISSILPTPSSFLPNEAEICSYGTLELRPLRNYRWYLWNNNSTAGTITITEQGDYWLEVTDEQGCIGRDTTMVKQKQCMEGFYMPNAFTPDGDGHNDLCQPFLFGNVKSFHFTIYNRYGQKVFETNDVKKGWDGRIKGLESPTFTFVWTCEYQLEGKEKRLEKGTVILIR